MKLRKSLVTSRILLNLSSLRIPVTCLSSHISPNQNKHFRALTNGSSRMSQVPASMPNNENGTTKHPTDVPPGMEDESMMLEAMAQVPNITKLHVQRGQKDAMCLTVYMSQRNVPFNVQRKYTLNIALDLGQRMAVVSQPSELGSNVILTVPSPSGSSQVSLCNPADAVPNCSLGLQLWSQGTGGVLFDLYVPRSLHGPLVNDQYFSFGASWSTAEDMVAYTAEAPISERTPVWGGPEAIKDQAAPKSWRGTGPALEDWGELNTGKQPPRVYVLDVRMRRVIPVPINVEGSAREGDMSFGQPVWTKDGSGIIVVGWPHTSTNFPLIAKKLGVVFCYNRAAYLYYVPCIRDVDGDVQFGPAINVTSQHLNSALSPTFSPDGSQLLFISHDVAVSTGTHGATAKLCKLPWPRAQSGDLAPEIIVDVIERTSNPSSFPGLYSTSMLEQPFWGPKCIVLNTQWHSQTAIIAIDIDSGQVHPLTAVGGVGQASYSLLAVSDLHIFASKMAPNQPPQLVYAKLPGGSGSPSSQTPPIISSPLSWSPVPTLSQGLPQEVEKILSRVDYDVTPVTPQVGDCTQHFESVNFFPKQRTGPVPTIIAPHGGPHTAITAGWYLPYAFLASLGFAVLCPNYRGSTGFGQASLSSLPGHIGNHDVTDCMATLQQAVESGLADPNRVAVVGGSHGGYLTAHLLGQFPDVFKAGVLRNPVCNLSNMVGATDINDWCWVETFGTKEGAQRASSVPKPDDLAQMFLVSPIAHVHKVKAPMMFMLGAKDRRVPLQDAMQYIAALRSEGASEKARAPRVITFAEDAHGLDRPQTEFEQWLNVVWWLRTNGMA